jgi:hypothetical protein
MAACTYIFIVQAAALAESCFPNAARKYQIRRDRQGGKAVEYRHCRKRS